MKPLFDAYAIVDWSAANTPVTGKDSVWIAFAERNAESGEATLTDVLNPPTREAAMAALRQFFRDSIAAEKRVFAGFDFAFGYPRGAAEAIGGEASWRALWAYLADTIKDIDNNTNNRFEVAGRLNREKLAHAPMFWGRPQFQVIPGLEPTKAQPYPAALPEKRCAESRARSAQPVWKLHTTGAVGSQTLMGIARLEQLRQDPEFSGKISIWPFDTRFTDDLGASVVIGEIYPSLLDPALIKAEMPQSSCADEAQVRAVAKLFSGRDDAGQFGAFLAAPEHLSDGDLTAVFLEEGWIVGLEPLLAARADMSESRPAGVASSEATRQGVRPPFDYLRDPAAIYEESFRLIRAETDLSHLPDPVHDLAIRLVHACGMSDIVADLVLSDDAVAAGRAALDAGAPILCDAEMVSHGIMSASLPRQNKIVCRLNDPRTRKIGEREKTTRSSAQVDLWGDLMEGAIVAIGNAPTALFRLLEKLDAGAPKPALIIGMPVGFVGAAEAKAELCRDARGVPFVTIRGRRGGSAMAAAAVNALARGIAEKRPAKVASDAAQD